ncbi:hypothetical protein AB0M43_05890 [Longispora sp. NPDC051575]|uniref:hypothetical protein n=1 Tax=Longispora sp. NPDC051575 TaxID=3154943 RepID=UPI003445AA3A
MRLADILDRSGLDVLGHLERALTVPVIDGLQAQGDLIVVPAPMLGTVGVHSFASWEPVPRSGVELVRGEAGNNPHTLVADPGTCHWTTGVRDPLWLAIGMFSNTSPVYLVHPEHGGSGVAPGRWVVRRQQERSGGFRRNVLVAD